MSMPLLRMALHCSGDSFPCSCTRLRPNSLTLYNIYSVSLFTNTPTRSDEDGMYSGTASAKRGEEEWKMKPVMSGFSLSNSLIFPACFMPHTLIIIIVLLNDSIYLVLHVRVTLVTRSCHTSHTFVLRSLHVRVTLIASKLFIASGLFPVLR